MSVAPRLLFGSTQLMSRPGERHLTDFNVSLRIRKNELQFVDLACTARNRQHQHAVQRRTGRDAQPADRHDYERTKRDLLALSSGRMSTTYRPLSWDGLLGHDIASH